MIFAIKLGWFTCVPVYFMKLQLAPGLRDLSQAEKGITEYVMLNGFTK